MTNIELDAVRAIKSMPRVLQEIADGVSNIVEIKSIIDWEQRRYDVAKGVFLSAYASDKALPDAEIVARQSIKAADAFIKEFAKIGKDEI